MTRKNCSIGLTIAALLTLALALVHALGEHRPPPTALVAENAGDVRATSARVAAALARPESFDMRGLACASFGRDERSAAASLDTCLITGRLEAAEASALAEAYVALLDPRNAIVAEARTRPDGCFDLPAKAQGPHRLLALARGREPRTIDVELETGRTLALDSIALSTGARIEGRVTSNGAPLPRVEVAARTSDRAHCLQLKAGEIVEREGIVLWARASADTRADGTYTIEGLSREELCVEIAALRGRENALDPSRARRRDVVTPAAGIDFELPSARLELTLECAGEPIAGVDVQIDIAGLQVNRLTDADGKLRLRVTPALAYPIIAARGGYVTKREQVRGLSNGEERYETIELEVQPKKATWVIDVVGAGPDREATFDFRRMDGDKRAAFSRRVMPEEGSERFVIEDVPEGRWNVSISSGAPRMVHLGGGRALPARSNCAVEVEALIPRTGRTASRVEARAVARIEIEARGSGGELLPAVVSVRDASGLPVPCGFATRSGRVLPSNQARLDAIEPTVVTTDACDGVVELFISHAELSTAVETVELQAGVVQRVAVVLRPK